MASSFTRLRDFIQKAIKARPYRTTYQASKALPSPRANGKANRYSSGSAK
jgi:hypothetical protein